MSKKTFVNFIIQKLPSKIYKLSKTNIFSSRFEGSRGEKQPIFRTQVPDGFGFATFNTIAASPQLGFALPTFANWQQFSFIDMHGLEDITIPTNLNSAYGPSPYDGLMSKHGSYFEDKEKYLKKWSDAMKCSEEEIFYETPYDGQNDFYCLERKCPEQVRY